MEAADRLLRVAEVIELTGLSRVTIHRLRHAGTFPEPLRVGPRAVRWRESELRAWMESQPRARDLPVDSPTRIRARNEDFAG